MNEPRHTIIDLSPIMHLAMGFAKGNMDDAKERFHHWMESLTTLPGTASVHLAIDTPPYERLKIDPDYKGNRKKKTPEERAFIRESTNWAAARWPSFFDNGAEADDIIAAFCKGRTIDRIRIVTADKDLMQLITRDNRIVVYSPRTNRHITYEDAHEAFGVYPPQILDLLAIMGDSSDNIKGCPGVGKVNATKLIQQYGSLVNILKSPSRSRDKYASLCFEHQEEVMKAYQLIKLADSVKLNYYKVTPVEEKEEENMEETTETAEETTPTVLGEHRAKHILTLAEVESIKATMRGVYKAPAFVAKSKDPHTLLAIAIQGAEMGFSPITFLQRTHVLHNSLCMSAHDIIGLARRAPSTEYLECKDSTPTSATYVYKAKGSETERSFTYDLEMAKKDRLKWVNREENRPAMIRKTAGCQAARLFCPESLHGLYGVEEMDR